MEKAAAIIDGENPDGPSDDTRLAILGCREAMTYALRVAFALDAHEQQVQRHLRRIQATEALWDACERLVAQHQLPSRMV